MLNFFFLESNPQNVGKMTYSPQFLAAEQHSRQLNNIKIALEKQKYLMCLCFFEIALFVS